MAESYNFDSGFVLGDGIGTLGREELVELARKLCLALMDVEGGYHGCVHPYNVSLAPDGAAGLGPKADHGPGEWTTWELEYMAPELFWNGTGDATVDVYSVGLMLYAGVTGGRLPFFPKSGLTTNEVRAAALRDRMNGENIALPVAASGKLGEVLRRALSYSPVERYSGPVEMLSALSECVGEGEKIARELYGKSESELTEQERLMAGIVSREVAGEPDIAESEPGAAKKHTESEDAEDEDIIESSGEDIPAEESAPKTPEEELEELLAAIGTEDEETTGETGSDAEEAPAPVKKSPAEKKPVKVDKDFEKREKKPRKHLKPILIILILLCALALVGFATKELWLDFVYEGGKSRIPVIDVTVPPTATPKASATPTARPTAQPSPTPTAAPTPTPTPTPAPRYELFVEDVSWTDAELACEARGGHLATVSDAVELKEITALAEAQGIDLVWIGFYRDMAGELKWVNNEEITFFAWAAGEPSVTDTDGTAENNGLLWHRNGQWVYNDSRNDPASDYPQYYSGKIGYICEYES